MKLDFVRSNHIDIKDRRKLLHLVRDSFEDPIHGLNLHAFTSQTYEPGRENLLLIRDNGKPIACALTIKRSVRTTVGKASFLSAGSVAVAKASRGRGLGKRLVRGLVELAQEQHCDGIYLQGISSFYTKLGFHACLSRSETSLELASIHRAPEVYSRPLDDSDLPSVAALYEHQAQNNILTALRTTDDWDWLVNHATPSYFFHKPRVVIESGGVVGYFCTDPDDPSRIREFVSYETEVALTSCLSAIANQPEIEHTQPLRVMTPRNSQLTALLHRRLSGEYIEHVRQDGGQLMYLLDPERSLNDVLHHLFAEVFALQTQPGGQIHVQNSQGRPILKIAIPQIAAFVYGYRSVVWWFDQAYEEIYRRVMQTAVPFIYQGDNL